MKVLYIFYLISLFVTTKLGNPITTTQRSLNKSNSEQCSGGLLGFSTLKAGEYKTINKYCIRAMCDEFYVLHYHGCATYIQKLPPNCTYIYLKMDSLNQYPDCCPYVDCYENF